MTETKKDTPVSNAYPDEQEKLDDDFEVELELVMKMRDLLDLYGYSIDAVLEDGLPAIRLVKDL